MTYIKQFYNFLKDMVRSRWLIIELTKKEFQIRYLGSYFGMLWAFIQPAISILILWFLFEVGFKTMPVNNFPFLLWLMAGILPWFFIAETLASGTNSIIESSYLVKKVVFRVSVLPIIKILSAVVVHSFFIMVLIGMFWIYGYTPTVYTFQVIYYLIASIILITGISWITASLIIFVRDLGQVVAIAIQFGFWATPIFWSFKILPAEYLLYLKLNPFFYIVEGYRDSLIHHIWFWEHLPLTLYFWSITLSIFVLGALVFRRLRPHFADVL